MYFFFPAENILNMFAVGFLLLLLGIFILLYVFFTMNSSQIQLKEKQILNSQKSQEKEFSAHTFVKEKFPINTNKIPYKKKLESSTQQNINDSKKNVLNKEEKSFKSDETQALSKSSIISNKNFLYIIGFLYYDTSHSTLKFLEEKNSILSDYLSYIKRLGNASLEWRENKFLIHYKDGEIALYIKDINEIRFLENCAIFIPNEKPYYYFLSHEINKLNLFLENIKSHNL